MAPRDATHGNRAPLASDGAKPGFSGAKQPPNSLQLYLSRQASSLGRYVLEQVVLGLCGWVPSVVGIALLSIAGRNHPIGQRLDELPAAGHRARPPGFVGQPRA